ncbi:MAG: thioredoxin domain-containing protein [Candidatus Pacebacteria bacterium]|nr:thioredoxin domain-containing protein [Candidatus Paceibacterota bacterium]
MEILKNQLSTETSPYLLQHRDNPVAWFAWGEPAFAVARRLNRPIFLSIGYSACHWCHVMAHESFEDSQTAILLNRDFISIKVDREELPDIDSFYMGCLQAMGESGGWPLSMFLTPQLEPFFGGTYFPPDNRYGRPSFKVVLQAIARAYSQEPDKIQASVKSILSAQAQSGPLAKGVTLSPAMLNDSAELFLGIYDPELGGIKGSPKFPQVPLLTSLWRAYLRSGEDRFRRAVELSLDRMCRGGIYDHLGGGFSRYSTDEQWLVPHFEKMLYDNAQLIEIMSMVWLHSRSPLLKTRIVETVEWLRTELWLADSSSPSSSPSNPYYGAFAAALDADSLDSAGHKSEGAFYIWQAEQIAAILGPDAEEFNQAYGVKPEGNWRDPHHTPPVPVTVLNQLHLAVGSADHLHPAPSLAASRARLLAERNHRPRPDMDYKILTDWNGMAISALATASQALNIPEWLELAEGVFTFIVDRLSVKGDPSQLHHSLTDQPRHPAVLEDYAQMIRASLVLYNFNGREKYLVAARHWLQTLDRDYWDHSDGGYFMSAAGRTDLLQRVKSAADSATPSGNGVMVENLAKLYYLFADSQYRERADEIIEVFCPHIPRSPVYHASLLNGFESLVSTVQVVIRNPSNKAIEPWLAALRNAGLADWLVTVLDGAECSNSLLVQQLAASALDGIHAFVCCGNQCSPPLTSLEEFTTELQRIRAFL